MTSKAPIFSIIEPSHFSDYGFHDPQIDYFRVHSSLSARPVSPAGLVLEEARKHKSGPSRTIDTSKKIKKNKKRWWKNALHFFKRKWSPFVDDKICNNTRSSSFGHVGGPIPAPIYITESRSDYTTPCRTTSRPSSSGPLAETLTTSWRGGVDVPYYSLREITMDQHYSNRQRMSPSTFPIYLVT